MNGTELCLICERPVPDYTPTYCCTGQECGCMGYPLEPCVCSKECGDALLKGIGKPMDERRRAAMIPHWRDVQNEKLRAGLQAIQMTATIHYLGQAFDPEHMRAIANYCVGLLSGEKEPKDLDEAPEAAFQASVRRIRFALERSVICIDDWINTYAEDHCDPERVKQAKERLDAHGTLSYLSSVQETNRTALGEWEGENTLDILLRELNKIEEEAKKPHVTSSFGLYVQVAIKELKSLIGES